MIVLKLADGSTLHDVRDNNRQVVGYISDAKNAVGTLDFDIYPKHPAYNAIKAGSTKIRAYRDGMWTHDYTVESVTNDLQLKKHVTATDELQYLERIEVPSYKTGVDGVPQTVSGFFMWLIEYYNVRSGGERFAFGQIEGDIIDPTKTLDRSSDSPATVASIVKDKIIDSLGGYVRVRRVDGVLTIDLKADAAGVCHQYIEFGENLVDYADEQDASELYTAVTAESKYKDDNGDEVTITLADAADGDYLAGYVKKGDTVTNKVAAAAYGVRRKHLTFDVVKNVYTLVENCEKYIAAHCEPVTTVNVSAADLSTLDSNVQSFEVGLYTRVKAAPMGFDAAFECQGAKRSLNDPTDDRYTLGWTWGSLSSINNRKIVETALGIGKLEQATTEIDQAAKDAAQQAQTAQDVANTANINATNAVTKADSAKEGATIASDTAQRAEAISAEAKQTATQANGVAQDASKTASTAAITAGNASATATEAKSTATQAASDLSNYATNTNLMLKDMQGQIDGSITTWFFAVHPTNENAPANEWTTTDLKNNHLGDLYYDTNTGYSYRWQVLQSVYSWQRITDVDVTKALADASKAQDTADAKRRVFYSQPVPPYDKGDLWSQGTNGEMLICATPKTDGMSFIASDFVKASKYTDDTKAKQAQGAAETAQSTANNATSLANAAQTAADTAQGGVDALGTRVTTAETAITQSAEQIALKANKTDVYAKGDTYSKTQADAAIKVSADSITSTVSETYATQTSLATTDTKATNAASAASTAQSTANTAKTNAATAQTGVNGLTTRMTAAESSITQQADSIALRATKTEVATAKSEAVSAAATDATTKANNAKSAAVSAAASDATTKANNALNDAKTYSDAQIKIQADRITANVAVTDGLGTRMSTVEQTASGLSVSLSNTNTAVATAQSTADTANANAATAQTTANTARTEAAAAAKTASNYMEYTSAGLDVGNKSSGAWSGLRSRMAAGAFQVLNSAGTVLSSFGADLIEIGKNSINSVIKLCGGKGSIAYYAATDQLAIMAPGSIAVTACQTLPDGTVQPYDSGVACNKSGVILKGAVEASGTFKINGNNMADYVVAQGTSGIWKWRKWSSGLAECWGNTSTSTSTNLPWEGIRYDGTMRGGHALPFALTQIIHSDVTIEDPGGGAFWPGVHTVFKDKAPKFFVLSVGNYSRTIYLHYYVTGTWK